ncbi:hypothetical protein LCGC14_1553750 [marine sediment metagenome]|uniref:Restriction endonuclease type IV Mrr domain-containing protein n=1 Tax=marine sediment metagenome TaxID=412755 RepID=A0A0F9IPL1_9ZZZZ
MITKTDIELLKNDKNFEFFTQLVIAKIYGGLVSVVPPESTKNSLTNIYDERVIFECLHCNTTIISNNESQIYECDCGTILKLNEVEFEKRFIINDNYFNDLRSFFDQIFSYNEYNIKIDFGERKKRELNHNSTIYIHITPLNLWTDDLLLLDKEYYDNIALGWKFIIHLLELDKRTLLFGQLVDLREEKVKKKINWKKIDEWEFQDMCLDILEKQLKYKKIVPAGKGPDQGKDLYGYGSITLPSNKKMKITTLIQCKYTTSNKSFTDKDIIYYIEKAKEHNCNTLLFITNGDLSGNCVTYIERGSYKTSNFFDVDFYNNLILTNYLIRFDDIRLNYFLRY